MVVVSIHSVFASNAEPVAESVLWLAIPQMSTKCRWWSCREACRRHEAVAQPSEHGGDAKKANAHHQDVIRRSFAEACRVLKPGTPLVCVYAHRTTGGAILIRALVEAGLTVPEAWPMQAESRGRVNALGAAALSDSIFFVARQREAAEAGRYEAEVEPELRSIARERVTTLWAGGKGIGGDDLLMAAVGVGLRACTRFARVGYANATSARSRASCST